MSINKNLNIPLQCKQLVIIGKIGTAYGIKGKLKIFSFTAHQKNILFYNPWLISQSNTVKSFILESWQYINNNLIVKLCNIYNRELAIKLTNCYISVDKSQLPILKQDEYYCNDILGCLVINVYGNIIGTIIQIIESIMHDVIVVIPDSKSSLMKKEYLIPFIQHEVIKNINLIDRIITIDWNCNY